MALKEILGLRPGEEVLIVTDFGEDAYRMAGLLFERATAMGGKASVFVQAQKTTFDDADRMVLEAIRACPDITITVCSTLSGNDPYGYHTGYVARDSDKYDHAMFSLIDGDKRMRGLICEGATDDILSRCVAIDYASVAENSARIRKALDDAFDIHVTTPVVVTVEDGLVAKVKGGKEAAMLRDVIRKGEELARKNGLPTYGKNARLIGELGIGTNPAARITGNLIEDEKVCGTAHFAVGYNYDNDGEAFIHQDCLVMRPSLWVDGKQIMKDGDLLDQP